MRFVKPIIKQNSTQSTQESDNNSPTGDYFERNPSAHHHIAIYRGGHAVLLTRRGKTFDREPVRVFVDGVQS